MTTIDRNSKNVSFPAQIGILLGLMGVGLIIGGLLSLVTWLMITGRPLLAIADDMLKPQYYNAVMAIQVISTFFLFFMPVYVLAFIGYRKPAEFMGFNVNINYKQIFLLLAILILTFPLSFTLEELNKIIPISPQLAARFKALEDSRALQEASLININSFSRYIISLVVIGLLPGLFEEVCFRAGLQNILTRWFKGPWIAIILTAIIFSAIHLSYYGFLVRFALGIILGVLFYYSGSIWLAVLFHFLYNGVQVTFLYLLNHPGVKPPKDIEENFPLWGGAVALILIIGLFVLFRENSLSQKAKIVDDDFPEDDFHAWGTA